MAMCAGHEINKGATPAHWRLSSNRVLSHLSLPFLLSNFTLLEYLLVSLGFCHFSTATMLALYNPDSSQIKHSETRFN
jgi:hypothetical protein